MKETAKRIYPLSDVQIVVRWLNAAKDAKALSSYSRVTRIRERITEFAILAAKIQEPVMRAWKRHANELASHLARHKDPLRAGDRGRTTRLPGISTKTTAYRRAVRSEFALNRSMAQYVFRPHIKYSSAFDTWRGGVFPATKTRWFTAEIVPGTSASEADAVLSLIQLQLVGDLDRVRLCQTCKARWFVGAKSNYRFCGDECREKFYKSLPDYLDRKAKNQRKYRRVLKRMNAYSMKGR